MPGFLLRKIVTGIGSNAQPFHASLLQYLQYMHRVAGGDVNALGWFQFKGEKLRQRQR